MRTLLSTITVATPDLGADSYVKFSLYETTSTAPTPGGPNQRFRLVGWLSNQMPETPPSVYYASSREEMEELVICYSRYDDHEEFPNSIDWYDDDGL